MKTGYKENIEKLTLSNTNFRQVLYTATHCQLVLMSLAPNEDIGLEVHETGDQFFRFEKGDGKVTINGTEYAVSDGDCIIVPTGAKHNVSNTSQTDHLKFYTLYSPPHHQDGIVRTTKKDARENEAEFDGKTSE
ncbi:cupin domain-containing protein [Candidatus Gracilibacteria bacterium]|nr:cupin domain-containing protein [Candidatus Gracilibacteria bacterium]